MNRRGATILWTALVVLTAPLFLPGSTHGAEPATPRIVELSQVKADPPKATDPISIDVGKSRFFRVEDYEGPLTWEMTGSDALLFKEVEKPTLVGLVQQGDSEPTYPEVPAGTVILWGKTPGTAELSAWGIVGGKPKKLLTKPFVVSGEAPRPPPRPDDDNDPQPRPDPQPPVVANPFGNVEGFRVLITFDSAKTTRPPAEQTVLYGKAVREYLDAKCVESPVPTERNDRGERMREWRIWPVNSDLSAVREVWRTAFSKRGGDDWILIGNGQQGYSGPLPKTEAETLELLRKYGGA